MSRIEDALKRARLLRSIMEDRDVRETRESQHRERGINVLIISKDPRLSTIVENIRSLSSGDIIASDTIAKGMRSLSEKSINKIDEYELRFTARMLEMLCATAFPESGNPIQEENQGGPRHCGSPRLAPQTVNPSSSSH